MTDTKTCTKCGVTKSVDGFNRNRSTRDGLLPWCKECHRADSRAYYEAHREEYSALRRAYREAHREELLAKNRAYYEAHREKYCAYRETRREERRANDRERYALLGHPTPGRWQEITRKHATRSGRWSEAEDKYLATSTDRAIDDALARDMATV